MRCHFESNVFIISSLRLRSVFRAKKKIDLNFHLILSSINKLTVSTPTRSEIFYDLLDSLQTCMSVSSFGSLATHLLCFFFCLFRAYFYNSHHSNNEAIFNFVFSYNSTSIWTCLALTTGDEEHFFIFETNSKARQSDTATTITVNTVENHRKA